MTVQEQTARQFPAEAESIRDAAASAWRLEQDAIEQGENERQSRQNRLQRLRDDRNRLAGMLSRQLGINSERITWEMADNEPTAQVEGLTFSEFRSDLYVSIPAPCCDFPYRQVVEDLADLGAFLETPKRGHSCRFDDDSTHPNRPDFPITPEMRAYTDQTPPTLAEQFVQALLALVRTEMAGDT